MVTHNLKGSVLNPQNLPCSYATADVYFLHASLEFDCKFYQVQHKFAFKIKS